MNWFSWLSKVGLNPPHLRIWPRLATSCSSAINTQTCQERNQIRAPEVAFPAKLGTHSNQKCLSKYFNKLVFQEESFDSRGATRAEPTRYQEHWRGALLRKHKSCSEEVKDEKPMVGKTRSIALTGPLDGRVQERLMAHNNPCLKLSGPLDGKVHESLMYTNRRPRLPSPLVASLSPKLSGPLDGRTHEKIIATNKSPRLSGQLDGRVVSPKFCTPFEKEREDV
ncbi:hypothetical protein ACFX13_026625 [Malus domestica]